METNDGSFERLDGKFLTCWVAVPGKGQDNNLKKTRGPKLRREGSRDDPRSGVKELSASVSCSHREKSRDR